MPPRTPLAVILTCLALVAASCSRAAPPESSESPLSGDVVIRGATVVLIDPARRYQTIEGFGTCLAPWDPDMAALYATPEFQRLYVEEVGCTMLRINLWGPVSVEPVEDPDDISYEDFVLTGKGRRAQVFLDFAVAIRQLDPDVLLVGSVWTPPPWMKINGSVTGDRADAIPGDAYERDGRTFTNRVHPDRFPHFARWVVEMVKLHAAHGVPLDAVSPGNEVMFTQTFDSCVWTAEDYAHVVGLIGELLEQEGLDHVRLFGPETMTGHNHARGNPMYVEAIMNHPTAAKHFDIFATHGYTDGFESDATNQSAAAFRKLVEPYGRPYWITEGGTGDHDWPEPIEGIGAMLHNALVAGHASVVMPWQIAEKKPTQHAIMLTDRMTPKTHAARQYFRFIRPGAVRIDAASSRPARVPLAAFRRAGADAAPVQSSAYRHDAHGTLTVVLTNPTDQPQSVELAIVPGDHGWGTLRELRAWRTSATEAVAELSPISVRDGTASLTLPPQCIVTLQAAAKGTSAPKLP